MSSTQEWLMVGLEEESGKEKEKGRESWVGKDQSFIRKVKLKSIAAKEKKDGGDSRYEPFREFGELESREVNCSQVEPYVSNGFICHLITASRQVTIKIEAKRANVCLCDCECEVNWSSDLLLQMHPFSLSLSLSVLLKLCVS